MINSLKILTNQQKDRGSPVKMVVQGIQFGWEKWLKVCCRKVASNLMDGLWKFIAVDNHEAVKVERSASSNEFQESGEAKVYFRFPESSFSRRLG